MKIKVSELEREKLAEWAARAQRWKKRDGSRWFNEPQNQWIYVDSNKTFRCSVEGYRPDINGGQAMELMKKFNILAYPLFSGEYFATPIRSYTYEEEPIYSDGQTGETPEIAICRAVVASVYGEYVEAEE